MAKKEKIRKGKKPPKKRVKISKSKFYEVAGENVKRTKKNCPKCGAGVFLAEHKDRFACGKCGYTEIKSSK